MPALQAERRDARIAAGAIPWDDMESEARTAGAASLGRLRDQAAAALEAWEAMANVLDEKASEDPPSTSHVRDMLRQIHAVAIRYAPAATEQAEEAAAETLETPDAAASGGGAGYPDTFCRRTHRFRAMTRLRLWKPLPLSFASHRAGVHLWLIRLDDGQARQLTWPELLEEARPDAGVRQAKRISLCIRLVSR